MNVKHGLADGPVPPANLVAGDVNMFTTLHSTTVTLLLLTGIFGLTKARGAELPTTQSAAPRPATQPANAAAAMSQAEEPSTKPAFRSYRRSAAQPHLLDAAKLDRITDGVTLGAIVEELGPGQMHPLSGTGIINWHFNDGRQLSVWPDRYKSDEVITWKGQSGRSRMWIGTHQWQILTTSPATTQSSEP
ncbi:MAG TPA: hypothetical protein VGN72_22730 [Tepidisphaeraceae bacterium]|nr:hypothetical protein [Tepidisphaeraceae bacterium]